MPPKLSISFYFIYFIYELRSFANVRSCDFWLESEENYSSFRAFRLTVELSDEEINVTVFLKTNVGNPSTVTCDFLVSFLCSFLDNRLNLINRIVAVFPEELKISLRTPGNKIGPRNEYAIVHPTLISILDLRLLGPSWTRIRVQPCLRSHNWAHNKEACGSAGCRPTEVRIHASSTSLLKVKASKKKPAEITLWAFFTFIFFCPSSEPPVPTTVPKLLEKRSKQLLVVPGDTYRGDGPIIFTKILYKPEKNGNSWSSIIGKSSK